LSDRRSIIKSLGLSGALIAATQKRSLAQSETTPQIDRIANDLHEAILGYQLDDTHCHVSILQGGQTTPDQLLLDLSLAALPQANYFPTGVLQRWQNATGAEKTSLDQQYAIGKKLDEIRYHFRESMFIKYMTKELAAFLKCAPKWETVVAARNERAKDYPRYFSDLFRDVKLTNAMVDTGVSNGMDAKGFHAFAQAILPCKMQAISRAETIYGPLMREEISFEELETRYTTGVRDALDGTGNYGFKSWGMKSHLLSRLGLIKPTWDAAAAKKSWEDYKKSRNAPVVDREEAADRGRGLAVYLMTIAMEECLKRDMPMQFHAGDGDAPSVILRRQHVWNLEEVVRFDRDGMMRMPKVILVHAGYPLVGEAAWMSHLYTNCYFDISLMNPVINQGLTRRFGEILEAVPMSKVLFGSDSWKVPEINWLAGKWGKRSLSEALAVHVKEKVLTRDEALEGAQMMLHRNNRRVYNLSA
jgi:predicted TIM-barrel fold metal-dependent hydrolase